MNSDEMFNWPDGDVILRSTHDTGSRDFQVHKLVLSLASPVFRDTFKHPLPSSATSNVDIVDVVGHPRAVELALRFIYPTSLPTIDDLTLLSEALIFADKYDIEAARSRLRPSLLGFAKTESLRVYAIACRLGFEDEMKLASSYTTSIHLRGLTQLPDEFRFIPATEYHRLVLLHARYRREFVAIAHSIPRRYDSPKVPTFFGVDISAVIGEVMWQPVLAVIAKGTPLNYESLALALKTDHGVDANASGIGKIFRSILDKTNALNLTV